MQSRLQVKGLSQFGKVRRVARTIGVKEAASDVLTRVAHRLFGKQRFYIHLNDYPYPIGVRNGTSDYGTMLQVFREKQYTDCESIRDPKLIVDFGANVGYASIYFLNAFPK